MTLVLRGNSDKMISSSVFLLVWFQACLLSISKGSQFSCPNTLTFNNARLRGGLTAGRLRKLSESSNTHDCIQKCCDATSCDLVAWIDDICYSVSCFNRDLCLPVDQQPPEGIKLVYIAERKKLLGETFEKRDVKVNELSKRDNRNGAESNPPLERSRRASVEEDLQHMEKGHEGVIFPVKYNVIEDEHVKQITGLGEEFLSFDNSTEELTEVVDDRGHQSVIRDVVFRPRVHDEYVNNNNNNNKISTYEMRDTKSRIPRKFMRNRKHKNHRHYYSNGDQKGHRTHSHKYYRKHYEYLHPSLLDAAAQEAMDSEKEQISKQLNTDYSRKHKKKHRTNKKKKTSKGFKKEMKSFEEERKDNLKNRLHVLESKKTKKPEKEIKKMKTIKLEADKKNDTKSEPLKKDPLIESLKKLQFRNDPGTVYRGSKYRFLKQCGRYVEKQDVTKIRSSWASESFSLYGYMYEVPENYMMCNHSEWLRGFDLRGDVFISFQLRLKGKNLMDRGAKLCEKACCNEPRCKSWVLRNQDYNTTNCKQGSICCWIKTAVPRPQKSDNSISGYVLREFYKHPPSGMRSAVPLGGLGTGSLELRADGTIQEWTLENQSPGGSAKYGKSVTNMALFGVRVETKAGVRAALLRTAPPKGYKGVEKLSYQGSYPVSKLTIGPGDPFTMQMDLYAYPAFHPRDSVASHVPAIAFTLDVHNPLHDESIKVSFMFNLPMGFQEDTLRTGNNFGEIVFSRLITPADCAKACAKVPKCVAWTTNGPNACLMKDKMPLSAHTKGIVSGLKGKWVVNQKTGMLTCTRPGIYPQSGSTTLNPVNEDGREATFLVADHFKDVWTQFKKTGRFSGVDSVNPTGLYGAVSITAELKPQERKSLTIILAWYYPNRDINGNFVGNRYARYFTSSEEVAQHMNKDMLSSLHDIFTWQSPMIPPRSIKMTRDRSEPVNTLPDWLQDMLVNGLSFWRSGMYLDDGRWRQWEALDCVDVDSVHNDMQRIIPYVLFYPELADSVLRAWAKFQASNGMIHENLSPGCLDKVSNIDQPGGRVMADVTTMFVVALYHNYQWTNNVQLLDDLWPAARRAIYWAAGDSTKGTGLPYRLQSTYDILKLHLYDHTAYNSIILLLALKAGKELALIKGDAQTVNLANIAFHRASSLIDKEFWDYKKDFYRAMWDVEYGSPDWLMADVLYGQVWAYTLGLGDLVDKVKGKAHLMRENEINDSPYGLKVITKNGKKSISWEESAITTHGKITCNSLENITDTNSIWMGADADWSSLMINYGMDPEFALKRAGKALDHYRSVLNDQWNMHGLTSSKGYGLDGLPWATSHYTFHMVLWHIPLAVAGQEYSAPKGSLVFWPKFPMAYKLPFFTPQATGTIEGRESNDGTKTLENFKFTVSSGTITLTHLSISGAVYPTSPVSVREGQTITWSRPRDNVADILRELRNKIEKPSEKKRG